MQEIRAVLSRHALISLLFFLPAEKKLAMERRLRGKEEFRKLGLADWVLISWGKSGRTWFRVMLSRFYQIRYQLPQRELLEFDNLKRRNAEVPRVFFSHNNYLRDYVDDFKSQKHFHGKKIVLLARDPRDVAVSQFFQWKYRMRPHKKRLNQYPEHGTDISVFDFVTDPKAGIPRIIEFLNSWTEMLNGNEDILLIRYEDMRIHPEDIMRRVLEFTGTPGSAENISEAVEFAAYENMKKMEEKKFFRGSGVRVKPGDPNNPQSFKVRRAKVGGYADYFDDEQLAIINNMVATQLDSAFGYTLPEEPDNN